MMRLIIGIMLLCICCSTVGAFPLKSKQKGDRIQVDGFQVLNGEFDETISELKLVLLWRSDKRTSKVILKKFVEQCEVKKIACLAVETQNVPLDKMMSNMKGTPRTVKFAHDQDHIIKEWGVFTLPVTLILNKNNSIIDALGYEGQYDVKLSRFIDLQRGDISQESYDKVTHVKSVNRESCKIASLNFINRLVNSGQTDDAMKKLNRIKPNELRPEGKLKYAEIYLKLRQPDLVIPMLSEMSEGHIGAKFYLAYAYFIQEKYDLSLDLLNKIMPIYPKKQKVHYLIGQIYNAKGDYKNAANYYAKSCNSDLF